MATNRFVCEICNKGFQRDQNLQLHRRGHNLPWKLRQRTTTEVKKRVYICPEPTCVHHNPARALGDLTGIKKHFSRKHGEKKWKCDKCSKKYAVQSDWKAHQKTCGTREYKCDCGTIFSRKDSFITHRAFCDALAEENNKVNQGFINTSAATSDMTCQMTPELISSLPSVANTSVMSDFSTFDPKNLPQELVPIPFKPSNIGAGSAMFSTNSATLFSGPRTASSSLQLSSVTSSGGAFTYLQDGKSPPPLGGSAHMSATALLQKAAQMGATASNSINSPMMQKGFAPSMSGSVEQISNNNSSPPIRPHPSFGGSQAHALAHDHHQAPDQLVGMGVHPHQMPHQQMFDGDSSATAMSDMGMYGSILQGRSPMEGSMTTLDFMGIGGTRVDQFLQDHQQQQQEQISIMNAFQAHGDNSSMGKPIWDV